MAELVAGRLTLWQAADRFRGLRAGPPHPAAPPGAADGRAEGERLCREVMARVDAWLVEHAPERATAVAARLEAELRQGRERGATARPPE